MKKRIIVFITIITLVLSIGITYAYFTSDIVGTENKLKIASKELNVIFTDTEEISNLAIEPGWSDGKSFTVENKSNGTYNYNIVFSDLINTFVTNGSLQYKITSSNGGYNMIEWSDIPKSNTKDDKILAYDIDIEKGVTQEYTIEFRYYDNPDVDQNKDIGKDFSGSLMIAKGSIDPNKFYSVTLNVENATIDENPKETLKKGSVEFNVTSDEDYTLGTNVTCDNNAIGVIENSKVTVSNITANTVCNLATSIKTYTVTVRSNNNSYGTVSPTSQSVMYGNNATITLSPKTHYHYSSNDCGGSISGNTMTISNVTSTKSCTVTYIEDTKYTITLNITGGSASSNSKTVYSGESATFTITANNGYTTTGATVTGTGCELNESTLSVKNVNNSVTCNVNLVSGPWNVEWSNLYDYSTGNSITRTVSCQYGGAISLSFPKCGTGYASCDEKKLSNIEFDIGKNYVTLKFDCSQIRGSSSCTYTCNG